MSPGPLRRCYDWVLRWADRPGGPAALFALAVAEAVFFPIPPDVLLIALCFGAPARAWRFAALCTAGSVVGGVCGYALGALAAGLGKSLIVGLVGLDAYYQVADVYSRHAFAALLIAGFTPIPYKVFAVSAGIFHEWVGLPELVAASLLSRAARFYLVAWVVRRFGPAVRPVLERHLGVATLLVGVGVVGGFVALVGGAGDGRGDVRLRGLAAEVGGGKPAMRREALALLAAAGAPADVLGAIDAERDMAGQQPAYAALRGWVAARAGPPPPGLDERWFRAWNGAGSSGVGDAVALAVHQGWILAGLALLAGVVAAARGSPRTRVALGRAAGAAVLAFAAASVVKAAVGRERPSALPGARVIAASPGSSSMPSRHAAVTVAAAVAVAALHPALGVGAALVAVVVGWARVYGGLHYPGDVLAGWVLGLAAAWVVGAAMRRRGWRPPDPSSPGASGPI